MSMKNDSKLVLEIIFRYFVAIIIGVPNLYIFYKIFSLPTIYFSYFLLNLFFDASLSNNVILVNDIPIAIIGACVAGSAYYLLTILTLGTPKIRLYKRLGILFTSYSLFFLANTLRIFVLGVLAIYNSVFFDIVHKFFWYFVSIILVVGIWFFMIRLYKIKEIPFYSDIKFLYEKSLLKK